MRALFISKSNPDGQCLMLDQNKTYKVIASEYNELDLPSAGILEVVGSQIKVASKGAFVLVLDKGMVQVVGK